MAARITVVDILRKPNVCSLEPSDPSLELSTPSPGAVSSDPGAVNSDHGAVSPRRQTTRARWCRQPLTPSLSRREHTL